MKIIRVFVLALVVFALAFANTSPSRAQGEEPPADAADIATLTRVVDLWVGSGQSNPEYLLSTPGALYFAADGNNGVGRELWIYQPPAAPIAYDVLVGAGSSSPEYLAFLGGKIYFSADGNDGAGRELWRFDWTNGAQRVTDIYVGAGSSLPRYMTTYNNELYFQANGNDGAGVELWKYDPVNGAFRVTNINTGAGNSYPQYLAVYNGALYFQANSGNGAELWKYDATNGAQLVADIYPGNGGSYPSYLAVYDGALYFSAYDNEGAGAELWMYDGEFGAQFVADINLGIDGSYPSYLTAYNGALYFRADGNDSAGYEFWKYDPLNGADRVADIYPGATGSFPMHMAVYNGALYFNANNGDGLGYELWKYDNTVTATFRSAKTHDGWILESSETSNAGGTLNNNAATFNLGDDAQNKQYRSIVSFNTSTLPDNAVIISATLRIRQQGVVAGNPFTTHGNILVDIMKGPLSGNNALQAGDFQSAPSKANVGTITNTPVNNWFSAALTKAGHPFVNLLGVTQFRLRFATDDNNDNGADFLRFFSADTALRSDHPVLVVKYYTP